MTHETEIAIIGGGPVGLMLALFLDRHGVRSVVFNTAPAVRRDPKGSTHNARTMEHYRRLGFADEVRRLGLPPDHPTDVAYFTRYNGWELARLTMPSRDEVMASRAAAGALDQVVEPLHRANQMYVEPLLFAKAAERANITVRFGWRMAGFAQDAAGVSLRAVAADGATEDWRAAYMVGCDGGRSDVRRALGIQYAGHETLKQVFFGGVMISSHLRIPDLYAVVPGARRAFQYWAINPEARIALVALNGRDEFLIWTPSETGEVADEVIAERVRLCTGVPVDVEVISSHAWTAGVALHAERFGVERVLLAGDAVHLFTPTGGFGMNTGVDDVANLSWKLAALLQGWGGPRLLASYEAERKPIAVRNTAAARALARSVGEVLVTPAIEQAGPAGEAERHEVGAFLATFGEEFASIGVQLGARYDGSSIIVPDGAPPADDVVAYRASGVPGGRAPHLWLDAGRGAGSSLYDRFGVGFSLVSFDPTIDVAPWVAAAARREMPLTVVPVGQAGAAELYGAALALVRPDQHVAWRGAATPGEPGGVLDIVAGF